MAGYICSSAIGVSGLCRSVAFMSSHYLDGPCGVGPDFSKSGHIANYDLKFSKFLIYD